MRKFLRLLLACFGPPRFDHGRKPTVSAMKRAWDVTCRRVDAAIWGGRNEVTYSLQDIIEKHIRALRKIVSEMKDAPAKDGGYANDDEVIQAVLAETELFSETLYQESRENSDAS